MQDVDGGDRRADSLHTPHGNQHNVLVGGEEKKKPTKKEAHQVQTVEPGHQEMKQKELF